MNLQFRELNTVQRNVLNPVNHNTLEWSGKALCYPHKHSMMHINKVLFFVFSTIFYSLMLHSLLEKRVPLKIFGKSHFFREICRKLGFLIIVTTNVINTIFCSPSFVMSFVILPFHTRSPQDLGGRKSPARKQKIQTNHLKFLLAAGRKHSSLPSQK